jgi:hypothetical protein
MDITSRALDHLLRAVGDTAVDLLDIGPSHPQFDRARAIRAAAGVLAKSPDALPAIARAVRTGDAKSQQTRAHLAAADAWLSGNPMLAAERYASILSNWPCDLLALRVALSCYFFLGWHEHSCALVDDVMSAWEGDAQGLQFVLAMASFAHSESGDPAYAEALGREALANDPACPMGVHAVAHAIAGSGRHRSGAQWMRDQRAHWAGESRMRTHNAWHLAMFEIEEGNVALALDILDQWLLPASARSPLDACDATALLWRLASAGVDDGGRWRKISDAVARTLTPGFWPYLDLHAALAHLSAGEQRRAQRLADVIAQTASGSSYAAVQAKKITQPGMRALGAWIDGRYAEAARLLAALQAILGDAGGSSLQLEVFKSIGIEAVRRQHIRQHDSYQLTSSTAEAMPLCNEKSTKGVLAELLGKAGVSPYDAVLI